MVDLVDVINYVLCWHPPFVAHNLTTGFFLTSPQTPIDIVIPVYPGLRLDSVLNTPLPLSIHNQLF